MAKKKLRRAFEKDKELFVKLQWYGGCPSVVANEWCIVDMDEDGITINPQFLDTDNYQGSGRAGERKVKFSWREQEDE